MRNLFFILFIFLIGCSSTNNIQEDVLYKTRVYVGRYEQSYVADQKFTFITTSMGLFKIKENPEIPDSSWCYVRIEYPVWDYHPDILDQLTRKYFYWNGSEKEYLIYNNIDIK